MSKKLKPFLAYSELTDCIYIIDGNDKYEVTEQCIKAMKATNRMATADDVLDKIRAGIKANVLDKIKAEIEDSLYVDSLIFGELIDFRNGKISADDVIEEFNRVTKIEVLSIIDKYKAESEEEE